MRSIKLLLGVLFFVLGLHFAFAQNKQEHVVARGETISSIASKYNVTEEALISENPILKNYIYVGMKIRIPEGNKRSIIVERTDNQVEVQDTKGAEDNLQSTRQQIERHTQARSVASSRESVPASSPTNSQASRWGVADKVGYWFVPKKSEPGSMLMFSFGADYSITKNFFVEGLLGYGYSFANSSFDYGFGKTTYESKGHYLTASQYANLILPIGNLFGVGLFTGPGEYLFLTGYTVIDKEKTKIEPDNRFSFSYDIGAKFYIGTFTIGVEYKISLIKGGSSFLGFFIGYTLA